MDTGYRGKVVIFTSFYSQIAFAPYVESLAITLGVLSKLGIEWDYWCRRSDFHVERALNQALTMAMNREDVTDIIIIDSDESWKAEEFVELLLSPGSVVGGTYRMKNNWEKYVGVIKQQDGVPVGRLKKNGKPLIEASRVSAGFMKIRKEVLKKYHDAYPELRSEEETPGHKPDEPTGDITIFFERMKEGKTIYCQDMAFCKRLEDIGVDMWIDPTLKIGHWGFHEYAGDFDKYLKGKSDADKAIETIREMAKAIEARS